MKVGEEIVRILEAFDLTGSYRAAGELAGCDHHTVRKYVLLRDAAPGVPWRWIAGMRDKVVHDYMGVDIELVWTVVQLDLPELALEVRGLLAQRRRDEGPA